MAPGASPEYDCVIVGAGLVGATLAIACDALGLTTALVEARDLTAMTPALETRGLALSVSSRRVLEGLDLWPELAGSAIPIRRIHVSDRGHFGFSRFAAAELGLDALGHVCPAATLAQVVHRRMRALAGCRLHCPATAVAVTHGADAVTLRVATGATHRELSGRLLIAADGVESATGALLGIEPTIRDYRRDAIVANVDVERPVADTAFERFTSSGPIALLPRGGARYVSIWTRPRDAVAAALALSDADYAAALSHEFGDRLGRITAPGTRQSFPLRLGRVRDCVVPRVLVIGNAATAVHPNAAQGLNLGLRDVATLIDCLAEARRDGVDIGALGVTSGFWQRRRSDRDRVARFTDTLATLFASEAAPLIVARDLAMLALDLVPPLKRAFLRQTTGISGAEARLARGLPVSDL